MAELADGWLVFETPDGAVKRRLCPYPADWMDMTPRQLEDLCASATPVARRDPGRARTARLIDELSRSSEQMARNRARRRTFRTAGGRIWQAAPFEHDDGRQVLRFTAEDVILDLEPVPDDWERCDDMQLAMLVLEASPPAEEPWDRSRERRQGDDLQP